MCVEGSLRMYVSVCVLQKVGVKIFMLELNKKLDESMNYPKFSG